MHPVDDLRKLREVLGSFATGVTVISCLDAQGEPVGFTANSFSSVSLDPPLVLFSLSKTAQSLSAFLHTSSFAVNVLREDQRALSERFADSSADKWSSVSWETWETGCPILRDALASFECAFRYTVDGGDHVIFVGEVERMDRREGARPLVYFASRYRRLDSDAEG
ncbi:MAG: flavin reductase family protein [Myxococcales bacterium]|nr:flavin reductase family protein [Myxococcales bacterium]MDH5307378.1 flavin reductase family protein [Myxococcales bacterium]MDH5568050.1 flavin reductase family protein [Myxococcales bacterium]